MDFYAKRFIEVLTENQESRKQANIEIRNIIKTLEFCDDDEFEKLLCKLVKQFKMREEKTIGFLLKYICRINKYKIKAKAICKNDSEFSSIFERMPDVTDHVSINRFFNSLEKGSSSRSDKISETDDDN